jgi:cyclophilin family peptidyl-prolyl cis-trans isomerase
LRSGLALLPLLAALVVGGCGGRGSEKSSAETTAGGCTSVSAPKAEERHAERPRSSLDPSKTWDVVLRTNCGSFTIRLDVKTSPATTSSFASLARSGYFDHTIFHRIVPGFVIQGGDPTATGSGGPGYKTIDRPPASARYTHDVVAMAKTPAEPPGTSGSQFFVVTARDAQLPPDYALLGKVVNGLDIVDRIGKLGDQNEQPTETVEIEKATVTRS